MLIVRLIFILCSAGICPEVLGWPVTATPSCTPEGIDKIETKIISLNEEELIEQGRQLFEERKYGTALLYYDRAIEKNPKNASSLSARGQCYELTNDLEAALKNYEAATAIDPENVFIRDLFINALFKNKKYKEAVDVLLAHETNLDTIAKFGDKLYQSDQYKEALRCYTKSKSYIRQSYCHYLMNEFEDARQKFVKGFPRSPAEKLMYAQMLLDMGRNEEAAKIVKNLAKNLPPMNGLLYEKLGQLYEKVREVEYSDEGTDEE